MPEETPSSSPPLAALILAGGASSRMGVPKAWLTWRGVPLLSHLAGIFAGMGARIVVVGARGQELPALPPGAIRVDDPPGDRGGPLVGLGVGLEALASAGVPDGELVFFSACDNVFLSQAHLDHLRGTLLRSDEFDAVLPMDPPLPSNGKRFAHPLASAARTGPALAAVRDLLTAGRRRPIALFDALSTHRVEIQDLPDPRVFQTCNTPDEYAKALADDDTASA